MLYVCVCVTEAHEVWRGSRQTLRRRLKAQIDAWIKMGANDPKHPMHNSYLKDVAMMHKLGTDSDTAQKTKVLKHI